jgi:hypothetical protein
MCSCSHRLVLQSEVDRVTFQWQHAAEQQAALHAEAASLTQQLKQEQATAQAREHAHQAEVCHMTQQLHEMREQLAAARDSSRCFEENAEAASEALQLLRSCCHRLEKEVAQAQAAEAEVREEVVVWKLQARRQDDVVQQLQVKVGGVEVRASPHARPPPSSPPSPFATQGLAGRG